MKNFAMMLVGAALLGMGLTGCGTTDTDPVGVGPQSAESNMPWNTPQPGEGSGAFGGVLDQNR